MNQVVCAPTKRPYLEQSACGMISPKSVMMAVEMIKPQMPLVRSPIKIDRPELTVTFPRRIVHSSKLPLLLNGRILAAYSASFASYSSLNGPLVSSSRFLTSSPKSPRLSPENIPDMEARMKMTTYCCHPTGSTTSGGGSMQKGIGSSATVSAKNLLKSYIYK